MRELFGKKVYVKSLNCLTDECVSDHSERIRSIQIDKNFITQTFRIYNFIISRTKLAKDPTPTLRLTINKTLENTLERCGFSKIIIHRLTTPPSACTQRFYTLPKTHKVTLKIRPIVSGRNGIFERLSWFLQIILKPLLRQVKAHVGNTEELLNRFHNCPSSTLEGLIPVSFDVVSLYTNIDIEEAISTALQYSRKYNIHLYGLSCQDLNELLHLLLENNIFEYPGHGVFQQIRGFAIGSHLSGTLAILAMDRFERNNIYDTIRPVVYSRYVDDIGTVVSSIPEASQLLETLNSWHDTINPLRANYCHT